MKKIFLTNKEELTEFFATEKENFKLIEKYEKNAEFFKDLSENGDIDDILLVISIRINKYVSPLVGEGYYTKAFKVLEEVETDLEKVKDDAEWYEFYSEQTVFWKAVCLGNLKKYRVSNQIFKELLKKKPTNDRYLNWYKWNNKGQIYKVCNAIAVPALGFVMLCIVLDFVTAINFRVPVIVQAVFWMLAIFAWITSYVWGKIIDKQRVKITERINAQSL